ncbi:MAG: shikimate kinase [Alphaproteobacteria bacterium]
MTSREPEKATTEHQVPAAPWRRRSLVLVGLMGAGKSSIGRRLADTLGWPFVDSDDEIAAAAGCSIADIFSIHGEPIFRDLEARVITRLLQGEKRVLATGGGAWMQPAIRAVIKEHATSVWLRADLDVLTRRVERRNHRPLLETGDKRSILEKLMAERYPVYAEADVVVDSGDGPQERVVQQMIAALDAAEGSA